MKDAVEVTDADIDSMTLELVIEVLRKQGHDMESLAKQVSQLAITGNSSTRAAGAAPQYKVKIADRIKQQCSGTIDN